MNRTVQASLSLFLLSAASSHGAEGGIPFPAALDAAAVVQDRLDSIERNALVLGNGDLNGLLYAQGADLRMRVSKNDVWDARVDTSEDPPLAAFDVKGHSWKGGSSTPASYAKPYPTPRICANLVLHGAAQTSPGWNARLDLRRATAEIAPRGEPDATVRVRALARRNAFFIESDRRAEITPQPASYLPEAETGRTGEVTWIRQRMPGDQDYPGMEVATALGSAGGRHAVGVATSWESKDPVGEAVKLVRETLAAKASALIRDHEGEWRRFWEASGVELGARDFQDWWYRMVYYMRCFSKPGVVPVGLWAGLPNDAPGWHSDYHFNYNNWQTFWAPLAVNHPDLAEPWVSYLKELLPRARWYAKTTYGCEGACFSISHFPFEPDPARCTSVNKRQSAFVPWSCTIGMAGMAAQNLWYCHLYRPDRGLLGEEIYPVLREVALFYASFMEKCGRDERGKVKLGPSYSPEHGSVGVDNVPYDIAYVRYTFDAAIAAAETLERDAEPIERWRRMRDLLPPYPTAPDESGLPVVVDWDGCKFREIDVHNITVPATPVFPGEQVTWLSPREERELFARTISQTRHTRINSSVIFNVARARLSMPEAIDDAREWFGGKVQPNGMFEWAGHGFYLSESWGIAGLISEFLVQGAGGVIRVFPCWPKETPAGFATLRTQGGFLVSAEQTGGEVRGLAVESTVGGTLRLLSPWPKPALVEGAGAAKRPLQPDARGIVEIETRPGQRLVFEAL